MFQSQYRRDQDEEMDLENRITAPDFSPEEQDSLAKKLVERFLATAPTNREVLVSLLERVELTEEKEVVLHFRFRELEKQA